MSTFNPDQYHILKHRKGNGIDNRFIFLDCELTRVRGITRSVTARRWVRCSAQPVSELKTLKDVPTAARSDERH